VEIQRGDQADNCPWYAQADLHKVGIARRLGSFQAVDPLSLADKVSHFHHPVNDVPWHAQLGRGGSAQDAVMLLEYLPVAGVGRVGHEIIIQQKYHTYRKVWYFRKPCLFICHSGWVQAVVEAGRRLRVAQDLFVGRDQTPNLFHGVDDLGVGGHGGSDFIQ